LLRRSALCGYREDGELRLQFLALAFRALGGLLAVEERFELVIALLADVLKDGHEEISAKKTATFYLKSKRGHCAITRGNENVQIAALVARRPRADGRELSYAAALSSAAA
jgi:hypothetical protein